MGKYLVFSMKMLLNPANLHSTRKAQCAAFAVVDKLLFIFYNIETWKYFLSKIKC